MSNLSWVHRLTKTDLLSLWPIALLVHELIGFDAAVQSGYRLCHENFIVLVYCQDIDEGFCINQSLCLLIKHQCPVFHQTSSYIFYFASFRRPSTDLASWIGQFKLRPADPMAKDALNTRL